MKRQMHHPESFIGKHMDFTVWEIPDGFNRCAMTGEFYPECRLEVTFCHYAFERSFLVANGIYIEDADWLSETGFNLIIDKLNSLGIYDYNERAWDFYTNAR